MVISEVAAPSATPRQEALSALAQRVVNLLLDATWDPGDLLKRAEIEVLTDRACQDHHISGQDLVEAVVGLLLVATKNQTWTGPKTVYDELVHQEVADVFSLHEPVFDLRPQGGSHDPRSYEGETDEQVGRAGFVCEETTGAFALHVLGRRGCGMTGGPCTRERDPHTGQYQ